MDNLFTSQDWLKRAKSNLNRGKENKNLEEREIFIEDLCFDLHQAAEKSFKAVLIHYEIAFPKTHDLSELIKLIKMKTTVSVPDYIKDSAELTKYAVLTRYPNWNKISNETYLEAVKLSEKVYIWAQGLILN